MLGGGRGWGCVEDSLDGPDHFTILSHGGESKTGLISLCCFKDVCDRCVFWAAACADNGSNVQLPGGKDIWTKLGGFGFRQPDSMVFPDNLLRMGGAIVGW